MSLRLSSLLLILSLMVTACGGGGGSAPPQLDTVAPVIVLNGASVVTVDQGGTYTELGATATDNVDDSVEVSISGDVDVNAIDSYVITYSATDSSDNSSSVLRTVNVLPVDTEAPVISLIGAEVINLFFNTPYTEQGATAIDNRDGSVEVAITGNVNVGVADTYIVTYTATDSSDNARSITRTVNVLPPDTEAPVITLNGDQVINLFLNETYTESGASAVDNQDGVVNVLISGDVNTQVIDTYIVSYVAVDSSDNVRVVTRTVNVVERRPFITTWKTDNVGTTANNQIKIGTNTNYTYNYTVNWGDGSSDTAVTGDITHTYTAPGTYTVEIRGEFPAIYFFVRDYDNDKLLSVEQWGSTRWMSMSRAFNNCSNLVINATDAPDLSRVTSMSRMFDGATLLDQDISSWDVSNVTDMRYLFSGASSFNQNINSWDVSNVRNMSFMFYNASLFNRPLNQWVVFSVTDMGWMFSGAVAFNQDVSSWDVQNVTVMSWMFYNVSQFNSNISLWDVSSVTSLTGMFSGASSFNQDIGSWVVTSVTRMDSMFYNAVAFNRNLNLWNIASVTNMSSMFFGATLSIQNYDALLTSWSTQPVQRDVQFHGGNSVFTAGSLAETGRSTLMDTYGWRIVDGVP